MKKKIILIFISLIFNSCQANKILNNQELILVETEVTWEEHISEIFSDHCVSCHSDGNVAEFSLETYEQVKEKAKSALRAIKAKRMPPWGPGETETCEPNELGWKDDPTLTQREILLLEKWIDSDFPIGDKSEKDRETRKEISFRSDIKMKIPEYTVVGEKWGGKDDMLRCFVLDPKIEGDVWMTNFRITPGNKEVVHHVGVWLDEKGLSSEIAGEKGYYNCFGDVEVPATLLAGWLPGINGVPTPESSGIEIPEGSKIIMQIHYHIHQEYDEPPKDSTTLELEITTRQPLLKSYVWVWGSSHDNRLDEDNNLIPNGLVPGPYDEKGYPDFVIPANVKDHEETIMFTLPDNFPETAIFGIGTHMHYTGKNMEVILHRKNPEEGQKKRECLIATPNYNFYYQRMYYYNAKFPGGRWLVPRIKGGDTLEFKCNFDNTMNNPFLAYALEEYDDINEPIDVRLGNTSLDEMCLALLAVLWKGD